MTAKSTARPPLRLPRGMFYGWVIVFVSFIGNWITAPLNPVVFSIFVVPMRSDLHLSLATLAWCITFRQISAGISAPILGRWLDEYGPRWVGVGCAVWAGLCLVGISQARDVTVLGVVISNVTVMYALFFISGFSGFGVFGGGQILTGVPPANWFIAKRGRAVSYALTGGGLGTAAWALISSRTIPEIGWRASWLIDGVLIIAVLVPLYGLLMRRRPEDVGLYPDGASEPPVQASSAAAVPSSVRAETNFTLREAIRTPALWMVTGAFMLHTFGTNAILFLRTSYWADMGIKSSDIGNAVAVDPFTVMLCTLLFGFLAERFPVRFITAFGGLVRALSMVVLYLTQPFAIWAYAHNFTWGVGSAGMGTGQNLLIPQYFGRAAQGAIRGFTAPIMIAAGALSPPLAGYMIAAGLSERTVFVIAGSVMLVAGSIFLPLRPPRLPARAPAVEVAAATPAS